MKTIVPTFLLSLFSAILLCFTSHAQLSEQHLDSLSLEELLQNNEWVTDRIIGLDTSVSTYTLSHFDPKVRFAGNLTGFLKDYNFHSQYIAWCGNDNFTTLSGTYTFLENDKLAITVAKVAYSGGWEKPTEYRTPEQLIFKVSKVGETLVLNKVPKTCDFNKSAKKPKCHLCKTKKHVIPYLYGRPTAELNEKSEKGLVKLGGCVITECSPRWYCKKHQTDVLKPTKTKG